MTQKLTPLRNSFSIHEKENLVCNSLELPVELSRTSFVARSSKLQKWKWLKLPPASFQFNPTPRASNSTPFLTFFLKQQCHLQLHNRTHKGANTHQHGHIQPGKKKSFLKSFQNGSMKQSWSPSIQNRSAQESALYFLDPIELVTQFRSLKHQAHFSVRPLQEWYLELGNTYNFPKYLFWFLADRYFTVMGIDKSLLNDVKHQQNAPVNKKKVDYIAPPIPEVHCKICGVFYKTPQRRRYQLGYIDLVFHCAHVWYYKTRPSVLSILLDLPQAVLGDIIYFQKCLISQPNYCLVGGDLWVNESLQFVYQYLFGQLGFEDVSAPWNPFQIKVEYSLDSAGSLSLFQHCKTFSVRNHLEQLHTLLFQQETHRYPGSTENKSYQSIQTIGRCYSLPRYSRKPKIFPHQQFIKLIKKFMPLFSFTNLYTIVEKGLITLPNPTLEYLGWETTNSKLPRTVQNSSSPVQHILQQIRKVNIRPGASTYMNPKVTNSFYLAKNLCQQQWEPEQFTKTFKQYFEWGLQKEKLRDTNMAPMEAVATELKKLPPLQIRQMLIPVSSQMSRNRVYDYAYRKNGVPLQIQNFRFRSPFSFVSPEGDIFNLFPRRKYLRSKIGYDFFSMKKHTLQLERARRDGLYLFIIRDWVFKYNKRLKRIDPDELHFYRVQRILAQSLSKVVTNKFSFNPQHFGQTIFLAKHQQRRIFKKNSLLDNSKKIRLLRFSNITLFSFHFIKLQQQFQSFGLLSFIKNYNSSTFSQNANTVKNANTLISENRIGKKMHSFSGSFSRKSMQPRSKQQTHFRQFYFFLALLWVHFHNAMRSSYLMDYQIDYEHHRRRDDKQRRFDSQTFIFANLFQFRFKWALYQSLAQRRLRKPLVKAQKAYLFHGIWQKHQSRLFRRYKLFERFQLQNFEPQNLFLKYLPVLPPTLRPLMQMSDGLLVSSDLNDFYLYILRRQTRLNFLVNQLDNVPLQMIGLAYTLVQQSVDVLLENGREGQMTRLSYPTPRALKSLTDIIKGKQGRFRHNLLGKRVDYSGRSVIVVGPKLRLSQCGLPRELALKLFYPFLLKFLLRAKHVTSIVGGKLFLQNYLLASKQKLSYQPIKTYQESSKFGLYLNFSLKNKFKHKKQNTVFEVNNKRKDFYKLQCFPIRQKNFRIALDQKSILEKVESSRLEPISSNLQLSSTEPKQLSVNSMELLSPLRNHNSSFQKESLQSFWNLIQKIIGNHPILLNRAPTLHRLGIQAFFPVLIPGRAIQLHPLVCPTFNADFDGDQMGIHIPLSIQAQVEARLLMISSHNWLSPATGEPNLLPSQDMVLGFYYLTTPCQTNLPNLLFSKIHHVIQAYERKELTLHRSVWLRWAGLYESPNKKEQTLEFVLQPSGQSRHLKTSELKIKDSYGQVQQNYIRTTTGRIFFHQLLT